MSLTSSDASVVAEGVVLGLGNPLLDITATVDQQFLDKYNLKPNDQILADESHKSLCDELIQRYEVQYSAGGSIQNSLRVMQWFFAGKPSIATYMGCVGDDQYYNTMQTKAKENGLEVVYMVDEKEPTGRCVCLITGTNRSLCAYLGASTKFKVSHLVDNHSLVESAKYFVTSGYLLGSCFESVVHVAQHCQKNSDKVLLFSLSAPFVVRQYRRQLLEIYPFIDYMFANESEARELSQQMDWCEEDIEQIARLMAQKDCSKRRNGRKVIVTQGSGPVIVAINKNDITSLQTYATIELEVKQVVDTTGAGDAFLGGFLANLIRRQHIDECVETGIYAASQVVQRLGCDLPEENNFVIKD